MIRFSIVFVSTLSFSLAGFAQGEDVETYILNKYKPKGFLPPIVLDTKNLMGDAQDVDLNEGAVVIMSDANEVNNRIGQMPNSYQGDFCIPIPNAYRSDNCIPIPNAYRETAITVFPDSGQNRPRYQLKELVLKKAEKDKP